MQKLKIYLEKVIVINFCIFLFVAPYSKHLVKVYFSLGIVGWLLLNILNYKNKFYRGIIPPNPLNKPILLFLIASVFSVIFSSDPYHSQSIFFERYLPYVMLFWMATGLTQNINRDKNTLKNLHILVLSFLLSGIFLGIGAVRDYFLFSPYRLFTVFGKEISFHMLGLYLTYFIPMSFVLLSFSKRWYRWLGFISLVLLVPSWVWHASRAVWISAILGLLIISTTSWLKNKNRKSPLLLFLILIFVFFIFTSKFYPTRLKKMFEYSDRLAIMEVAVKMFENFPLFGAGLGMYEKSFSKYWQPPPGYEKFSYLHAHNTYLEVLSEMGIVGFLAFLGIFVAFLKKAFKAIKNISSDREIILLGLTGNLIATLILALFGSIILVGVQGPALFWFLFGMAAGCL